MRSGSGDTKRALEALRDRLIVEMDQAPSRYVAGLSRELLAVLRELDRLQAPKPKRSMEDELKARRADRVTARGEEPGPALRGPTERGTSAPKGS